MRRSKQKENEQQTEMEREEPIAAVRESGLRSRWIKVLAFLLCVVCFTATMTSLCLTSMDIGRRYGSVEGLLSSTSYQEGPALQTDARDKIQNALYVLKQFKSEEYVRSGKTVDPDEKERLKRNLYFTVIYDAEIRSLLCQELGIPEDGIIEFDDSDSDEYNESMSVDEYLQNYDNNSEIRAAFNNVAAKQIDEIVIQAIQSELHRYQRVKDELDRTEGVWYYVSDGKNVVTNLKRTANEAASSSGVQAGWTVSTAGSYFENLPARWSYVGSQYSSYPKPNDSQERPDRLIRNNLEQQSVNGTLSVYVGFDQNYLNTRSAQFDRAQREFITWLAVIAGGSVLFLISLIYLIVTTGRKNPDGTIRLAPGDRFFPEIQWTVFLGAGTLAMVSVFAGLGEIGYSYYLGADYDPYNLAYGYAFSFEEFLMSAALLIVCQAVCAAVSLYAFLTIIRGLKRGHYLRQCLIYRALAVIGNTFLDIYRGGSVTRQLVIAVLGMTLLSALFFLWPFVAAVSVFLVVRWAKKYDEVKKGVQQVKAGNLSYKIPLSGKGELDDLARDINAISEGFDFAVQNELKNQRLKTDLISNVSHDIKTPLTSIITYVDLLKKEGLDSPDALKYVEVLEQKSARLKKLTEDLFEAAKASSGDMPVHIEKVEMLSLINQGLVEFGDRIQDSGLEFIINAPNEKYYVSADGQLLWRVVENLIGNVLKYAQENTRVYIDLHEEPNGEAIRKTTVLEIKNVSKAALNIPADELMERFKRGDESRATEGSGLGLAIAKDLVSIQKGWFNLVIDGDLFKAIVGLETYPTPFRTEERPAPELENSSETPAIISQPAEEWPKQI